MNNTCTQVRDLPLLYDINLWQIHGKVNGKTKLHVQNDWMHGHLRLNKSPLEKELSKLNFKLYI